MKKILTLIIVAATFLSCKKYLNAVPDSHFSIPKTFDDYQYLLNSDKMYNTNAPVLSEYANDDMNMPQSQLLGLFQNARNSYIWADDIFQGLQDAGWINAYQAIYYANVVLDGLENSTELSKTDARYLEIRASALYLRAFQHFLLTQTYAKPFDVNTANSDLGIPYKVSSRLDDLVSRGTILTTYNQIIADINAALPILPSNIPSGLRNKPTKAAAYALLSRIYLTMRDYSKAEENADNSLKLYNTILDFNDVNASSTTPFPGYKNPEVLMASSMTRYSTSPVDVALYNQYDVNDLRKAVYFSRNNSLSTYEFKGSYNGSRNLFNGLATDEIILNKAECLARRGENELALNQLNSLLMLRYKKGTYTPYSINTVPDVLGLIISERRKELVFRGLRWSDLRRYNLEGGRFAKDISHEYNGITYILKRNDHKYTFPIPPDEIAQSHIEQN